jgi:Kef-type K+ transport system membrane component KefB
MSNFQLSIYFFLQLVVILAVCRGISLIARKFGQPSVIAEMIAGVLLGPSLFGLLWPNLQASLFPKASMTIIFAVSQVGLVLYMFLIGMEFQPELLRKRIRTVASVSLAGIVTPFILGSLLALYLLRENNFFAGTVSVWQAMLFLGAAMSITAFPMLARIIHDCGLSGTPLGTLALAAGSIDDVCAWGALAIVLASFSGQPSIAILAIGGGLLYVGVVLSVGKSWLRRLGPMVERKQGLTSPMLSFVLILLMLGAFITDAIQIYAVFGAFVLGVAMPRGILTIELKNKLEPITKSFLLPLYFVYSGLNTRIGLLNTFYLWMIALLVLFLASFGKGVACYLAAMYHGETRRDAMAIGTLMNARGLMELIMLNIALEKGIITPTLFAIMVIMAIGTTLLATPVFNHIYLNKPKVVETTLMGGRSPVMGGTPLLR